MWLWLLHVTGADDTAGTWYGFWSGFAGCIPEFAVFGLVWRRVNCHAKGCWRVGLHRLDRFHVCRKHHPDHDGSKPYTAQQIAEHVKGADDR
jgi:hypothetical protein